MDKEHESVCAANEINEIIQKIHALDTELEAERQQLNSTCHEHDLISEQVFRYLLTKTDQKFAEIKPNAYDRTRHSLYKNVFNFMHKKRIQYIENYVKETESKVIPTVHDAAVEITGEEVDEHEHKLNRLEEDMEEKSQKVASLHTSLSDENERLQSKFIAFISEFGYCAGKNDGSDNDGSDNEGTENDSTRKRKVVDDCTPSERLTRSKAKAIIDAEPIAKRVKRVARAPRAPRFGRAAPKPLKE